MPRSGFHVVLALLALGSFGRAASPIAYASPHGVMVVQALHTLGAWVVPCSRLPGDLGTGPGEVLCAQVPGPMYGFFREAVHGRLYEYLDRKTLTVVHDWSAEAGTLRVAYAVDGGTLTVRRERANDAIYAVFQFLPGARTSARAGAGAGAASSGGAPRSAASGTSPATSTNHGP